DAVNRAAMIILKLINNKQNILLIDEIENGIHYTAQKELWRTLFRLSLELNVQIFATTHSLEMIKSFTEVGLENEKNQALGGYFELTKHFKSQQIIGIKRDLDTLDYAIEHSKGVRGE
ncbi:MAG TPA: AAA family ATPase, partial [Allocoleopsis sp.]